MRQKHKATKMSKFFSKLKWICTEIAEKAPFIFEFIFWGFVGLLYLAFHSSWYIGTATISLALLLLVIVVLVTDIDDYRNHDRRQ